MRRSELLALRWIDFDENASMLAVTGKVIRVPLTHPDRLLLRRKQIQKSLNGYGTLHTSVRKWR
ncbi:hypothetical protein A4G29_04230 [Mycobacterium kansasii]|nr:hypothetical protein A4G29_04230 [Mycobacterium kansasii]